MGSFLTCGNNIGIIYHEGPYKVNAKISKSVVSVPDADKEIYICWR